MAEPIDGKLIWQGEGKNKKRLLSWMNKQGAMTQPNRFPENQLAAELRDSQEDEIAVHLELESGQPRRIRPVGQEWRQPEPVAVAEQNAPRNVRNHRRGDSRERDNHPRHDMENRTQDLPREFHNPYNFVPAPDREGVTGELGDRPPSGHDRYQPDLFSGKLHVKISVETPLLVPDAARVTVQDYSEKADHIHKSYPLLIDINGRPQLAVTSVKGMLRSAYEAVTNSRLSVFKNHDQRLAFRMESTEGAMSVPARIEKGEIVLYTGTSEISKERGKWGRPLNDTGGEHNATLCAAWLPNNETGIHGQKLFAWLERIQHMSARTRNEDFQFWRVRRLAARQRDLGGEPEASRETRSSRSLGEFIEVEGFVCNTGDNIKNKHDERFFFLRGEDASEAKKIIFDKDIHGAAWDSLIKDYRREHSKKDGHLEDPPSAVRLGREIQLEWSRHIQRTHFAEISKDSSLEAEDLSNSPLCYARVRWVDDEWKVDELVPVVISRRVHRLAPAELLPRALKPATIIDELSPADRVFGWVNQDGAGAYRGQLRIGAIECTNPILTTLDVDEEKLGLPLAILGQPKPQQGRFYVARNTSGDSQVNGLNNERAGYTDKDKNGAPVKKGLRGRKVYPHHAKLPDGYWVDVGHTRWNDNLLADRTREHLGGRFFQEYRRPMNSDGRDRDNQNRSVQAWVGKGTTFGFDMHFVNISAVELGALLWLLRLNSPGQNSYFHRLGGGKPLGFGSVRLDLDCHDILNGNDSSDSYRSLSDPKAAAHDTEDIILDFQKAVWAAYGSGFSDRNENEDENAYKQRVEENFKRISFIAAFMRSAQGFSDKLPIHYPRARPKSMVKSAPVPPNPEGEAFKWFVANTRKGGPQLGLRDLVNEKGQASPGLPILDER